MWVTVISDEAGSAKAILVPVIDILSWPAAFVWTIARGYGPAASSVAMAAARPGAPPLTPRKRSAGCPEVQLTTRWRGPKLRGPMRRRASLLLQILVGCLLLATLTALAYTALPDPLWNAGVYDDADHEDLAGLLADDGLAG